MRTREELGYDIESLGRAESEGRYDATEGMPCRSLSG